MMRHIVIFSLLYLATAKESKIFENVKLYKKYHYDPQVRLNYKQAKEYCYKGNSTLVQVRSRLEMDWILSRVKPKDEFHLGAAATGPHIRPTTFLDGSKISFTDYSKSLDESISFVYPCNSLHVHVDPRNPDYGKWFTYDCSETFHVICEKALMPTFYIHPTIGNFSASYAAKVDPYYTSPPKSPIDPIQTTQNLPNITKLQIIGNQMEITQSELDQMKQTIGYLSKRFNETYSLNRELSNRLHELESTESEMYLKMKAYRNQSRDLDHRLHEVTEELIAVKRKKPEMSSTSLQTVFCSISVVMSIVNVTLLYMIATGRKISFMM